MGPEATADLYLRIIRIFQQKFGAKYDDDFPDILIYNLPLPDVVKNSNEQDIVRDSLIYGVKQLENAGVDFIAIPCNTVTLYLKEVQEAVKVPLINIVEESAKEAKKLGVKCVGIIGTQSTIKSKIYENGFAKIDPNITVLTANQKEQKLITPILMNILVGNKTKEDTKTLLAIIENIKQSGANRIVLGCTEIPLLIKDSDSTIDTLDVLAKAVVRESMKWR